MPLKQPAKVAAKLLATLEKDRNERLLRIDAYIRGEQDDPYMPDTADVEYKLLAERSITNVMPFVAGTPAQAMYVDQFRRGKSDVDSDGTGKPLEARETQTAPEWDHWQKSRLDGRQQAVYRGALNFGHAFVLTEKTPGGVRSKGLSPLRTTAVYEDAANDDNAVATIHVTAFPSRDGDKDVPGRARMWDDRYEYAVTFAKMDDAKSVRVDAKRKIHGAKENPVTRFVAAVDLEGRTCGVVEPMIPLQNRINQTVFDLLIVQSFASFKVRTISGMAPPMEMRALNEDDEEMTAEELEAGEVPARWVPKLDKNGQPLPKAVNLNARRVFWAEDHETKFSTLDETPLDGFIQAIELGFRHMAALSQTPPHHILGEIANLSAEALEAAQTALDRKVDEFKASFGESWERVFRIAAQIGGFDGAEDFHGEAIWRDLGSRSLNQVGDGLAKLRTELQVPARGLWKRIPNVTANELAEWEAYAEQENEQANLLGAVRRTSASTRPQFREPTEVPAA